ncbi:Uncharacterised protein [Bordetella pertussis]|nr:Uncharacterised protein [Bordetella pertussis]CPJ25195.1 Uncharacterised protein [Bordetella pertussis]CPK99282.1 Uncharacterised protein [Bordetella pertussis]
MLASAVASRPMPAATPIAAVSQMPAEVVRPRISPSLPSLMMTPAPRKPMPAITPCSTRLRSPTSMPPCSGTRTNSAAPRATSMWVRSPAALPLRSRS